MLFETSFVFFVFVVSVIVSVSSCVFLRCLSSSFSFSFFHPCFVCVFSEIIVNNNITEDEQTSANIKETSPQSKGNFTNDDGTIGASACEDGFARVEGDVVDAAGVAGEAVDDGARGRAPDADDAVARARGDVAAARRPRAAQQVLLGRVRVPHEDLHAPRRRRVRPHVPHPQLRVHRVRQHKRPVPRQCQPCHRVLMSLKS